MKRMAIGFAITCLAFDFARAQTPDSNVTVNSGQIQASGQELLPEGPSRTITLRGIDPATKEPIYEEKIEPPPEPSTTKYIAQWLPGGFQIALQSNPTLCVKVYTKPVSPQFYSGEIEFCRGWNTTRWRYYEKTRQLGPMLSGDGRCLSTFPKGGSRYFALKPCSDPDNLTHNKKWRLAPNGQIVSVNNALLCLSVEGMSKAKRDALLRIHNCAATDVRWVIVKK